MPFKSKYIFVASMDVDPDKEALFNEVYDTEHVPFLSKVPGVHGVSRVQGEPFTIALGGEMKKVARRRRALQRHLRDRRPARAGQPRVGGGWREGPLGQGGAALHTQSPARALQGALRLSRVPGPIDAIAALCDGVAHGRRKELQRQNAAGAAGIGCGVAAVNWPGNPHPYRR